MLATSYIMDRQFGNKIHGDDKLAVCVLEFLLKQANALVNAVY